MKIDFMKDCKKVRLGDICEIIGGGTPDTSNIEYWNGNIPWISSSDLKEDDIFNINIKKYITKEAVQKSSTNICPANSILLVSRVGVGKIAVSDFEICTSQDFTNIIECNCDRLYLTYVLYKKMQKEINNLQGTSIKGITSKEIKKFIIALPPIEIQQKIAEILSTQDKVIELKQKLVDQKKQQKKWLMQKIFSQELRFKRNNGADFPQWEEKRLIDIGKAAGGSGFNEEYQGYMDLDIPFYKVSDMNTSGNERIMSLSNNYVSNELLKKMKLKAFFKNSIIFAKVGAALLLDRKRIAYPPFLVDNNMMIFAPKGDSIFLLWLYYWFTNIKLAKLSQVGALPSINVKDIEGLKIKVPCFEEQTAIAEILSSQDKEIELLEKELEQEKLKKKALMQLLLTVK